MNEEEAKNQIGGQSQPNNGSNFIGTGEGEVPLANLIQKTEVRTMASDTESLKETGGAFPQSYTPKNAETQPKTPEGNQEKDKFIPPTEVGETLSSSFIPETSKQFSVPTSKGGNKKIFVWTVSVLIIIAVILAGYFFLYPAFFGNDEAMPESIEKTEEIVTETLEAEKTITEEVEEPITPETEEIVAPALTIDVHASLLSTPADFVSDIILSSYGLSDFMAVMPFDQTSMPILKEVVFKTGENKPLSSEQILRVFSPGFFTENMMQNFKEDPTVLLYANSKGTWLGFVLALKEGAMLGNIQDKMSALQGQSDLSNFFLVNPGNLDKWEDGKVKGKPTSLAHTDLDGGVLSYTWFGKNLLISTNLEGATEIATRLGY